MQIIRKQLNEMLSRNGRMSNTKAWAFIGSAVATWIMIHITLKDKLTWELFVAYLGSVAGFSQISKLIAYKYGSSATVITPDGGSTTVKCEDCPTPKLAVKKEDEGSD